jgi:hypothetical protein
VGVRFGVGVESCASLRRDTLHVFALAAVHEAAALPRSLAVFASTDMRGYRRAVGRAERGRGMRAGGIEAANAVGDTK